MTRQEYKTPIMGSGATAPIKGRKTHIMGSMEPAVPGSREDLRRAQVGLDVEEILRNLSPEARVEFLKRQEEDHLRYAEQQAARADRQRQAQADSTTETQIREGIKRPPRHRLAQRVEISAAQIQEILQHAAGQAVKIPSDQQRSAIKPETPDARRRRLELEADEALERAAQLKSRSFWSRVKKGLFG